MVWGQERRFRLYTVPGAVAVTPDRIGGQLTPPADGGAEAGLKSVLDLVIDWSNNNHMSETNVRRRGRPPRHEGARDQTRAVLLRAGTEILTEHGFASTGIDLVLKRAGVPKGSFYYYFSSKEEFGAAVIEQYASYFANKLDRWLLDASMTPLQRFDALVADARAGMARFEFRRGCLIGNLGQELGALNENYRAQLEAVFCDWQRRLAACFEAARLCGQLVPGADPEALAEFFWIGWEGAVLRAKLVRNADPLDHFYQGFLKALPRGD